MLDVPGFHCSHHWTTGKGDRDRRLEFDPLRCRCRQCHYQHRVIGQLSAGDDVRPLALRIPGCLYGLLGPTPDPCGEFHAMTVSLSDPVDQAVSGIACYLGLVSLMVGLSVAGAEWPRPAPISSSCARSPWRYLPPRIHDAAAATKQATRANVKASINPEWNGPEISRGKKLRPVKK